MDDRRRRGEPHADLDRFRLRAFVEALHAAGELEVRDDPVDLGEIAAALEANPKAVLFRKAGPEGWELTGNVMASRGRLALAFGTSVAGLLPELLRRLRLAPEIVLLPREHAPAQEVVLTGDEADLTRSRSISSTGWTAAPTSLPPWTS